MEVDGETKENFIIEKSEKFMKWLNQQPNKECTKTELNVKLKSIPLDDRQKILQELESRDKVSVIEVQGLGNKPKIIIRSV